MRTTAVLNAVHIGRLIKEKWWRKGKLKLEGCRAQKVLTENNIKLYQYEDLEPKPLLMEEKNPLIPVELPLDKNHPDYKAEPCYIYGDNDVLVEGLEQAKILTKCEDIAQLPQSLIDAENKVELTDSFNEEVQRRILQSCVFDAHQEKLPKRKDPQRPAYNFPRDYGITDIRKNKLLLNNLVQLCDQYTSTFDKSISNDALFIYPMRAFGKLIQLELSAEVAVRSLTPLSPPKETENDERNPIKDMYPIHCTISLKPNHFYNKQNFFAFSGTKMPYIHTVFFSFNKTEVMNLYEEPVTTDQILGRNLMKGFAVASSQARALYGDDVTELEKPVVIQIVMADEGNIHFSVFQLNSLDVENENGKKNLYWNSPIISLYDQCQYINGIPMLEGFNPDVMKRMMAFYRNQ
ncbi:UNVERIFIED_CONTAM: hypothetical protein PYX00_007025 [Menopon gallinae]|uniref:Large ribosomal subunit protein mL37 n=1 Tax=Menopon gallinae TaxID=328185 RepID=A0AAW2HH40_9NEOP